MTKNGKPKESKAGGDTRLTTVRTLGTHTRRPVNLDRTDRHVVTPPNHINNEQANLLLLSVELRETQAALARVP